MNVIHTPDKMQDATGASRLKQLERLGQSPWLDFIQRNFIADGSLKRLVDQDGLKGVTSNPSIFQKAMGEGTDYDAGFKALADKGDEDGDGIYGALSIEDIQHACDVLRPVYERTKKEDGYVSLEVSPYLAMRTDDTIAEARKLWKLVGRDNLMVKVPGTEPGVPAIRQLIADGLNINVTLLFSRAAYAKVADAFMAGLEDRMAAGKPVSGIASVASFFVSRIDVAIDKKIDQRMKDGDAKAADLKAVRGKVAIANAKLAYQDYLEMTGSERWKSLAAQGAMPQRLLWASTGTKDKAYSDVLYVDGLIGRDTVNTLPPETMDAFRDHGTLHETITEDVEDAKQVLQETEQLGLDLDGVTDQLVTEGVQSFADSFDKLLASVAQKRLDMLGDRIATLDAKLPDALSKQVDAALDDWRKTGKLRALWRREAQVWTGADEAKWLGWLDIIERAEVDSLKAFAQDVKQGGFTHVLLLGMGGSSLGPEVFGKTFGQRHGWPELLVLDSTDPAQVAGFAGRVDLAKTLVIVASKSGSTLEPNILKAFFWDRMVKAVGKEKAGSHFVAITDPGSKLEAMAKQDGFRRTFLGDPEIGGRYSVLSNFGLVPAAAIGLDLDAFLQSAALMRRSCAPGVPPKANPGVHLGAILGAACNAGRDKVTAIASPGIADVGAWLEQLLAESTGKQGKGIVPVDDEALGPPDVYGDDRLFAYLRLADTPDVAQDKAVKALEAAGQPVVRVTLGMPIEIGQVFYLWEFATAVAGSVIGIDPFDQPDVEASKVATRKLTDEVAKTGKLPQETPFATDGDITLFADPKNAEALGKGGLDAVVKAHLARVKPGDYVAILAYVARTKDAIAALHTLRGAVRDALHVATCVGFGPRFLHSTGQAYKGGPNSGVFIQVTAEDAKDLEVPGEGYSFGTVEAAQARGDFDVLAERGRRALRVHLGPDVQAGLDRLSRAVRAAL